jgi:hypothetical protein
MFLDEFFSSVYDFLVFLTFFRDLRTEIFGGTIDFGKSPAGGGYGRCRDFNCGIRPELWR